MHICAYLHSCAYVCIYVENVHMCDKMLKCAHLCIFRLVCACTGQICCLMHMTQIVLYFQIQYSLQFVLYVYMEFILYFVFSPTLDKGGSRDSRHYHSCVHNLRVSTVYTLMLLYLLLYLQHYFRTFAPVFFNFRYHPCVYSVQKKKAPEEHLYQHHGTNIF